MSNEVNHIHELADTIGPRPAGTNEEQQAAFYVGEAFKRRGLSPVVEEFSCPTSTRWAFVVCYLLTIAAALISNRGTFLSALALIFGLVAVVLLYQEMTEHGILSSLRKNGISQNVVASHIPEGTPHTRRHPIVIVAHYDSERSSFEGSPTLAGRYPLLRTVVLVACAIVPFIAFLQLLPLPFSDSASNIIWIITLVAALPALCGLIGTIVHRFLLGFTDGANDNASGVAAMLGVLDRLNHGIPSEEFAEKADGDEAYAVESDHVMEVDGMNGTDVGDGAFWTDEDASAFGARAAQGLDGTISRPGDAEFTSYEGNDSAVVQRHTSAQIEASHVLPSHAGFDYVDRGDEDVHRDERRADAAERAARMMVSKAEENMMGPGVSRPYGSEVAAVGLSGERIAAARQSGDIAATASVADAMEAAGSTAPEQQPNPYHMQTAAEVIVSNRARRLAANQAAHAQVANRTTAPASVDAGQTDSSQDSMPSWWKKAKAHRADEPDAGAKEMSRVRSRFADLPSSDFRRVSPDEESPETEPVAVAEIEAVQDSIVQNDEPQSQERVREDSSQGVQDTLAAQKREASQRAAQQMVDARRRQALEARARADAEKEALVERDAAIELENLKRSHFSDQDRSRAVDSRRGSVVATPIMPDGVAGVGFTPSASTYEPEQVASNGHHQGLRSRIPGFGTSSIEPVSVDAVARLEDGDAAEDQLDHVSRRGAPTLRQPTASYQPVTHGTEIFGKPGDVADPFAPSDVSPVSSTPVYNTFDRGFSNGSSTAAGASVIGAGIPLDAPAGASSRFAPITSDNGSPVPLQGTGTFAPVGDPYATGAMFGGEVIDDADDITSYDSSANEYRAVQPGYVDIPESRAHKFIDGISDRFSRKGKKRKASEEKSTADWLGVETGFDAHSAGRKIGSWDNFNDGDDDEWKGGGASTGGYRANRTGARSVTGGQARPAQRYGQGASGKPPISDFVQQDIEPSCDEDSCATYTPEEAEAIRRQVGTMAGIDLSDKEVWFVATGASGVGHAGVRAFIAEHGAELGNATIINLDCVGAGHLAIVSQEGIGRVHQGDRRLQTKLHRFASAHGLNLGLISLAGRTTDATAFLEGQLHAVTLMGFEGTAPAYSRWLSDTSDVIDERQVGKVANIVADFIMGGN